MSLNFAQRAGLRLCALAVTALMISGMLHPACAPAEAFGRQAQAFLH
jgi:hypothetical protein